jgi:tRNA A-37 threonylcarbamoyl transferase component Bud32
MTLSSKNCPRCGAPIPEEAPHGLCPKCLLGEAAAPTESGSPQPGAGSAPAIEAIAAAFPDLEILGVIGQGGMGVVYKARQPRLDRIVALKILLPHLGAAPDFAERFLREARTLARLNHPNIVTVHDFGERAGFFHLVMEYVDGVNLRQAMRAGRFAPEQALAVVPKICEALQYAHDENVLHRDIKPENILIDSRGRVKIADFGIAKLLGQAAGDFALTHSGARLGTPAYMAPEQIETPADVDHRADIYSLGVVFYEMLTGELPIGRFAPPSRKSRVDPRVDEVVLRTLEKERDERFQSAGEVKTRVETISESRPSGTRVQPSAPAVGGAKSWSHKAVWGAVLVGLSVSVFAVLAILIGSAQSHAPTGHHSSATMFGALIKIMALGGGSLFGLLPALAGTILGWMAMREIRESAGTRRGAGLAVFAAFCWPGLLGLAFCLFVVALLGRNIPKIGWLPVLVAGAALFVIVMIAAIRRALRWTTPRTRQVAPDVAVQRPRRRRIWPWFAIPAVIVLTPIVWLFLPYFAARHQPPLSEVYVNHVAIDDRDGQKWLVVDFTAREASGFDLKATVMAEAQTGSDTTVTQTLVPAIAGGEAGAEKSGDSPGRPIRRGMTHQRAEWRLPNNADPVEIERVRRDIERTWLNGRRQLEPGERQQLFWMRAPEGGAVSGHFEVRREQHRESSENRG